MTIPTIFPGITLNELKKLKNSVIGNPSAKEAVVENDDAVKTLVEFLRPASGCDHSIRTEAAHVLASLAHGSDRSLESLLRHDAHRALLFSLRGISPQDPMTLKSALIRALKTVAGALADIVGPPLYGIPPVERSYILAEAKDALASLLSIEALDIYLPMLNTTGSVPGQSTVISTTLCQLISSSVRSPEYRKTVVEWLPPLLRKENHADDAVSTSPSTSKKARGWEKPGVSLARGGPGSGGGTSVDPIVAATGGWTVRILVEFLSTKDGKLQEAALEALASLAKDNPVVAHAMTRQTYPDHAAPSISLVHGLTKSRNADIQLAACVCAARIIRACGMTGTYYLHPIDDACVRSILSIVNRILGSENEPVGNVIKSCFVLYFLVTDDRKLCQLAFDRGCLDKLAKILKDITPPEAKEGWDEIESENTSKLREAVLTALATLSLFNTDVRRSVSDTHTLLPLISVSLTCKYTGVRYAACQMVRMLARTVAVLRTNLVDTGLGLAVFQIFKRDYTTAAEKGVDTSGKGKEDRRVVEAALKAVCNIVLEFSPLRPAFLERGVMPRLMELIHNNGKPEDEFSRSMRLNAMWAVKNLLWKSSTETKRDVMNQFGWKVLFQYLHDPNEEIQEQAYHIIKNVAESDEGIAFVYRELCPVPSIPPSLSAITGSISLLDSIANVLLNPSSPQAVVLQATGVLANLANGDARDTLTILHHPRLLQALRTVIAERGNEIRKPAVGCILQLVKERDNARERRRLMINQGVGDTLRRVCEWAPVSMATAGGAGGSGAGPGGRRLSHGSSGMGAPHLGGYLHPSDRVGGVPGTSPTHGRSGSVGGHHGTILTSTGAYPHGPTLASPPSPGVHIGYHVPRHPHYHLAGRGVHHPHTAYVGGVVSASVPAASSLGPPTPGSPAGMGTSPPPPPPPAGPYGATGFTIPFGGPSSPMGYGPMGGYHHSGMGTTVGGLGSIGPHQPPHPAVDIDKEVFDNARSALDWLDHGDMYGIGL